MLRNRWILSILAATLALLPSSPSSTAQEQVITAAQTNAELQTNHEYCAKILSKVDAIVTKHLYNESLAKKDWPRAKSEFADKIAASKNLMELDSSINDAIKRLHSSHCQFVTINDETYYFLNSLFSRFNHKLKATKMDFTGIVCGGVGLPPNQVRYVIDGSPGDKAHIQISDKLIAVAGQPYVGQSNFFKTSGKPVALTIERDNKRTEISVTPVFKDAYGAYVEGITKSAKIIETPDGKIGYVHSWAGGNEAHDALEDLLGEKLSNTDGMVLDLRDGYGGNSLVDLDYFYRNPLGYPNFVTIDRSGKKNQSIYCYDKPLVALINGGSRSGKELLAYSLKKSGRAPLVGERTAGAVLAGRLFPIDDRTALYLAVASADTGGVSLEGSGVQPDITVSNPTYSPQGAINQLEKAKEKLRALIKDHVAGSSPKHES